MPENEQEFDKLLREYGARRRAEVDGACRKYSPPTEQILASIRESSPEAKVGIRKWLVTVNLLDRIFPRVPAWGTALATILLVGATTLVVWRATQEPAERWITLVAEVDEISMQQFSSLESHTERIPSPGRSESGAAVSIEPHDNLELPERLSVDTTRRKLRFDFGGSTALVALKLLSQSPNQLKYAFDTTFSTGGIGKTRVAGTIGWPVGDSSEKGEIAPVVMEVTFYRNGQALTHFTKTFVSDSNLENSRRPKNR